MPLPGFLIIGAQKAGTTAAARNLSLHPGLKVFSGTTSFGQREIEFFNQHWEMGITWYASHFEEGPALIGEKTAELLHRTICHERMFQTNPEFKLVVLLRCPVERAYSQWRMAALHKGDEPLSFESVIERSVATLDDPEARSSFYNCSPSTVSSWRQGYLLKGMYAEQLQSVLTAFPKGRVFVGISERLRSAPIEVYDELFAFLGLEPQALAFSDHFVGRSAPPMSTRLRTLLSKVYREPNDRLFNMLGGDIPEWSHDR